MGPSRWRGLGPACNSPRRAEYGIGNCGELLCRDERLWLHQDLPLGLAVLGSRFLTHVIGVERDNDKLIIGYS